MKRKAQLWRFCDENQRPIDRVIPRDALHAFIAGLDPDVVDMTLSDPSGYRMDLTAAPGSSPHLIMHRVREADLPRQWHGRRAGPLDPNILGLAEATDLLLLPRNLAIFMVSGYGPRPARLGEFLRARLGWDVWLRPVPRPDVGRFLANLERVNHVEVAIASDEARRLDLSDFFEGDGDPLSVFQTSAAAQQGGVIRIRWSVGRSRDADQSFLRSLVERLLRADVTSFSTAKAQVRLEGSSDPVPVDFLHDSIVTSVDVPDALGRTRALDPEIALEALEQARRHFSESENINEIIDPVRGRPLTVPNELLPAPGFEETSELDQDERV